MPPDMTADEFTAALKKLDLKQVELARIVGKTDRSIRNYAAGKHAVDGPIEVLLWLLLERPELVQVLRSRIKP